ncbi:2'-5' RNA ligase family protein [Flavivirga jejuensis]|uniref:Mutarotase n=1 Tax=Flavivirga jejuensis TaxID=870487 RepID=A0ABT8WV29_9FLAO|nr:mutarotase [Flavivirga jejuensis]MDO5976736.1 mutarotase [Flavivirga jejuensis]
MNLEEHYNDLYSRSIKKISSDQYEIDHLINASTDNRFGITLLIRPPIEVKNEIQKFINALKIIEPNQYYYKNSDIHITIMSIISCYNGFNLNDIDISKYIELIKESLIDISNLKIKLKGVTASPSCLMIQGFMSDESLNSIRNNLRDKFKNSNLQQSIDKRYSIQTAHSTVVRFTEKLNQKLKFLETIKAYKTYDFGTFNVKTIELVYNDWYQKEKYVTNLFEFDV